MMMNTNNTISMAYNNLTSTNNAIEKISRALSTGLRIAHASDDAAGLALTQTMSAQIAGVERAIKNSQDGISMLQVAESAMSQINSMLQRMRELAVQSASDTLTSQDRGYLQLEIDELRESINSVASNTTFNTKRLLDGSSSAIWSSDDATTKLKTTGAVTSIDQFGQKKTTEGNYRIEVKARAGQGQVQKTGILTLPKVGETSENSEIEYSAEININDGVDVDGVSSGEGWSFEGGVLTISADGNYSINGTGSVTSNRIVINEGVNANIRLKDVNITTEGSSGSPLAINGANVKMFLKGENTLLSNSSHCPGLEIQNVPGGSSGSLVIDSGEESGSTKGTLIAEGTTCSSSGIGSRCQAGTVRASVGNITINGGTVKAYGSSGAGIGSGGSYAYSTAESHVNITINGGDITAVSNGNGAGIGSGGNAKNDSSNVDRITINGGKITATGNGGGAAIGGGRGSNGGIITISDKAELTLSGWIDTENGATQPIGRGFGGSNVNDSISIDENSTKTHEKINSVTLEEIPEFYNASGVFLVNQPQKITITQGNGNKTDVIIYSQDTIEDVRRRLNDAIAFGLGQSAYSDNLDKFVTFVYEGSQTNDGLEAVAGTFVIRSAVAGSAGTLNFTSDNQDLLNALALNTIQEAEDNIFTASIYDAHTGKAIVQNLMADGNSLNGVLSPNMSIEFDSMANVKAHWNATTNTYVLSSEEKLYNTVLHIHDRSTSFQIGQNFGEDIYINIGDMRAEALGINRVDISTREKASASISMIDTALHRVNSQRSKIGTYQNELEYNANSLTQTGLHMQEAESRIKDTDMAKEYMEFIKLQILNGTGGAMLSQLNQNSDSLLKIMGV